MPKDEFQIEEPDNHQSPGLLISKRSASILTILTIVIFAGSLIGVYKFNSNSAKSSCNSDILSTTPSTNQMPNCPTLYCQNPFIIDGKFILKNKMKYFSFF